MQRAIAASPQPEQAFLRKSSGLVRSAGAADVFFFNLGLISVGIAIALDQLFFKLADLVGVRPIPEVDAELMRPADIAHLVGDGAKLRAATGWTPRYSLDDTLRDVLDAQAN